MSFNSLLDKDFLVVLKKKIRLRLSVLFGVPQPVINRNSKIEAVIFVIALRI